MKLNFEPREILSLSDIQFNSRQLLEGLAAKGGEGLREFLTQLYPDRAHFLYELLQNAEDAGATNVRFELTGDRLIFAHDGTRLFTLDDIDSITNVAASTKRDDHTRIGKFGVGFKAVYDFTDTPEIHSGDFKFKIVKLFYPEDQIETSNPGALSDYATIFFLPFDRAEKSPEAAYEQISDGLSGLPSTTLLFLRNICSITYTSDDGSDGSIERVNLDDRTLTLRTTRGSVAEESRWLKIEHTADVANDDQDGETSATIAAAFQLDAEVKKTAKPGRTIVAKSGRSKLKFVPVETGEVSIFFPTASERSGLKFHIHAPFESIVSRDSIRDTAVNRELIDAIGTLVADYAVELIAGGGISNSFLDLFPLDSDPLDPKFLPIRNAITETFTMNAITPSRSGFARASELNLGTKEVMGVLGDSDMLFLKSCGAVEWADCNADETPYFVKLPGEKSPRARAFISQLFATKVDSDSVLGMLASFNNGIHGTLRSRRAVSVDAWLELFDDKRLQTFYQVLGESLYLHDLSQMAIVRVIGDGHSLRHVTPSEAWLPDGQDTSLPTQVSPAIWNVTDSSDRDAPLIRGFLEEIGVPVWNAAAVLSADLEALTEMPIPDVGTAEEFEELKRVSEFVQMLETAPELASEFTYSSFLIVDTSNGERARISPFYAYFDGEIEATGWQSVAQHLPLMQFPIWSGYAEIDGIADFLEKVGANGRPRIADANVQRNKSFQGVWASGRSSHYQRNVDWDLEHSSILMKRGNGDLFRAIWWWALNLQASDLRAFYRNNREAGLHSMSSNLVEVLKKHSWVEDRDGNFLKPKDVDRASIHPDLPFLESPVLAAIDFGGRSSELRVQSAQREAGAHSAGFDTAEVHELSLDFVKAFSKTEMKDMLEERLSSKDAPEEAVYGDRRAGLTAENAEIAPARRRSARERSVRENDGVFRAERRAYLRAAYMSGSTMFCQGCRDAMPFQRPDGADYFEAIQCFENSTEHPSNTLSLCPLCAAKFRSWKMAKAETWHVELLSFPLVEGQGSASVSLQLAGVHSEMYFTGKHLKDIQILLKTSAVTD